MKKKIQHSLVILGAMLIFSAHASAQFISGSSGVDGALNVTSDTILPLPPSGIFNYTTVHVASGATLTFTSNTANTPVRILAIGDVIIEGTISVSGQPGGNGLLGQPNVASGSGGPGGFSGGIGGYGGSTQVIGTFGLGPGGGAPGNLDRPDFIGPRPGGRGGLYASITHDHLVLLPGGSGGGGAVSGGVVSGAPNGSSGGAGGGGAGAILIAASGIIRLNGAVRADGGDGGGGAGITQSFGGGGGSGGGIRLVANRIEGVGSLSATGGPRGTADPAFGDDILRGPGGSGLIRLESLTSGTLFSGSSNPPYAFTTPMVAIPSKLPTLTISSIGGQMVPANPSGSLASIDINFPPEVVNPVSIIISATNIPINTTVVGSAKDTSGAIAEGSANLTGTQESSSATLSLNLQGGVSIIEARSFNPFTVTASLAPFLPRIGGEPVKEILVGSVLGGGPSWTLVTPSGRRVPARMIAGGLTPMMEEAR